MKKFWNWITNSDGTRTLRMDGPIDEESFWGDEITPKQFRQELESGEGDVTLWINSPGGNVFAAAEIYTMLRDYKGKITVKIDAIAASAASVIAMAGNTVLMSPVAMLMIHDPSTVAFGNTKDMEHAISVLSEVKESIINAYAAKTGLTHSRISKLMENETWMNAKKAVELGFADEILFEDKEPDEEDEPDEPDEEETEEEEEEKKPFTLEAQMYSGRQMNLTILNRLGVKPVEEKTTESALGADPETPPVDTPTEPTQPVIGLDGKTEDGSMPYQILMKQLECMQ